MIILTIIASIVAYRVLVKVVGPLLGKRGKEVCDDG